MARYTDPFGDMDDIFNQLWGNNGLSSESSRYMINGHEVTPEEFRQYRQTGRLPNQAQQQAAAQAQQAAMQQQAGQQEGSVLQKLGRNLTQDAREGKLDPVIGRKKEIQEAAEILARRTKNNPVLVGDAGVAVDHVGLGLHP